MLWVPTSDDAHVADKETLEEGEAALGVDLGQIHGSLAALLGLRLQGTDARNACSSLVAHLAAVAASRDWIPASCQY